MTMVDIDIHYAGELRTEAKHRPSGATFVTDAPVDNQGRGESFSPTDLVATGLGTCMVTVMGIRAKQKGWSIDGTDVHVKKHMSPPPRRIARLEVTVRSPAGVGGTLSAEVRAELEDVANHCPVRLSLLDAIEVPVTFDWG